MRINKYLSACGICSRREADRLIAEGKVTVKDMVSGDQELVDIENIVTYLKEE